MSDAQRERLAEFLTEHDLQAFPCIGFRYLEADEDEAKRKTDQIVEALHRYRFLLQGAIVATEAGAGNRFERTLPLDEKLARLSTRLAPLAAAGDPLSWKAEAMYASYISVQLPKTSVALRAAS